MKDTLTFANIIIKVYYNKSHKSLRLFKDNIIYLHLHYDYKILEINNRKLYYQSIDSFKILKKIKILIYRLELFSIINIYLVISIAQLESISSKKDLYSKSQNINLSHVVEIKDKIEILLDKQIIERNKVKYLIK